MKNTDTQKDNPVRQEGQTPSSGEEKNKPLPSNDHTGTELDSDHSGSDCDNDNTGKGTKSEKGNRFDKPKRETDPDTTGTDIHSDKTKK